MQVVKPRREKRLETGSLEVVVRLNGTYDQTQALTEVKEIIAENAKEIGRLKRIISTRKGKVVMIAKDHEQIAATNNLGIWKGFEDGR